MRLKISFETVREFQGTGMDDVQRVTDNNSRSLKGYGKSWLKLNLWARTVDRRPSNEKLMGLEAIMPVLMWSTNAIHQEWHLPPKFSG